MIILASFFSCLFSGKLLAQSPQLSIDVVTERARLHDQRQHNFVCQETSASFRSSAAKKSSGANPNWKLRGQNELEVRHVGKRFASFLIGKDGKPAAKPVGSLGGFRWKDIHNWFSIFEPSARTQFRFEAVESVGGRVAERFHYTVPLESDRMHIRMGRPFGARAVATAFHGYVWADRESADILRIQIVPEPPPDFGLQDVSVTIDYALQEFGNEKFLLPQRASAIGRTGDTLLRNDITAHKCRLFSADATIQFEDSVH
jgi:hypothetical protein